MKGAALLVAVWLAAPDAGEVRATMHGNLAAVVALQPLLASPEAFKDPKNAATIYSSLAVLSRMKHQFMRPLAQEPAAAFGDLFSEAVDRAEADFSTGHPDVARARLRGLTGMCMSCHARQVSPKDFAAAEQAAGGIGLAPLERAEFLAATRQFDAALALWGDALSAPRKTEADSFALARAMRAALGVSVRAKDDASATVALLEAQAHRTDLPSWQANAVRLWLVDAQAWQAEKLVAAKATPAALFQRASALVDASRAAETYLPRDGERIKLLRATAYLSLALEREPHAKWRGQALYRLGIASASAFDPELYELDGIYLEACVRENPHTPLALRCIDLMSERTLFNFTGSGGTRLPPDVSQRLDALRALAK
ncbi:MAG: hypothetical protein IPJ65_04595 [Archangiaceae bacterium]|nr:hypothetical protein [Archangiaceae bacterium]